MTEAPSRAETLARALRRVQWSVLGGVGVCAAVALAAAAPEGEGPLDRRFTFAAVALAAGSIVTRRSAARSTADVVMAIASLLFAGGVGVVAVALALAGGTRQTAILFALGAALLALRPTPVVAP